METIVKPNKKVLLSKNKLYEEINKVIKDRHKDIKLRKRLNDRFLRKGLDGNTVLAIFSNTMELQQLEIEDINKLICLTEGMYEELKDLELYKLKPSNYFSDMELLAYDLYKPEKEELLKDIQLNNVIRINDYEYLCYLPASYLSKLRKSGLLKYRFDIQRPARVKKGKNGEIVEQMNINKNNIAELKNRYKGLKENGEKEINPSHNIIVSQIYFCILLEEGKTPLFKWDGKKESGSVGSLYFKPVFDRESDNYAPFIIPDGYHRYLGKCDAFDESNGEGELVNEGFSVLIYLGDKEKATKHVEDTFKRADINSNEKKKIEKSDVVDATDKLINGIKIFNEDNIAPDYEYFNIYNGKYITYRTLLIDSMKETGDNFDILFLSDKKIDKMAKFINTLFSFFELENVSKDSLLYSAGIFVGYIALANELVEAKNVKESSVEIIDYIGSRLIELQYSQELKDMKLNNKSIKIKEVFKYFERLGMEVEEEC